MYSQTLVVPTLRVSSPLSPRSVPSICISPAADAPAYSSLALEPTSPEDALSPRSTYLLPPPVRSPSHRTLSPVKAADKKGIDQNTFQDLLAANRERAAKRSVNVADRLRREVVVKAHHTKQIERRALFLSRIAAPPSPTSAETAVTPPETPAIFHFSLPSPGLASPLELFETVTSRERWIEQVDYKKPQRTPARENFPGRLPSLDQITARLRSTRNTAPVPSIVVEAPAPAPVSVQPLNIVKGNRVDEVKPRSRLPASIIASTRARAASPPTPFPTQTAFAPVTPTTPDTPSKLILSSSPPKSIKPVLVPQSIPALRINRTNAELAPVPVMSWRERQPTPTKPHMAESWRQEVPIKKELVRDAVVTPITPRPVMQLPIGVKPAPPVPRETRPKMMTRRPEPLDTVTAPAAHARTRSTEGVLKMEATGVVDGVAVSRRSTLLRTQKEVASALKLTESERRAVQGRNMVDKLRRRISAPAELQGTLKKGVPVGGF